ncbi:hypothetical protein BJV82DRAFT_586911 [Fennellomyces sp. T-0311]|nr:hypothetical protein BJV82DRAFT_586911 [Fennellomyces sp. T-0311]
MDWQMCMDWTRVYNGALEIPSAAIFESLTCLSLDTVTNKSVVRDLLQRSPNLRCVRLANSMGNHYNIVDPVLSLEAADISMIVDTCPDVEYIECNRTEDTKNDEDTFVVLLEDVSWWKTYVSRSLSLLPPSPGLRVLKFFGVHGNEASERYDFDNVIKVLRHSQGSLETLHLAKCKLQGLDSLHMQKLEKLVCKTDICQDITQLATFIKQSPQLNRFELNVAIQGLDNDTLIKTLAKHPSLKTLVFHMRRTDSRSRSSTLDLTNVCRLLRALGSHNDCHVENIAFGGLLTQFGLTNGLLDAAVSIPSLRGIRLHGERSYGGMMVPMVYDDFIPWDGDEGWDSDGHHCMDEDDDDDSDTDNYQENGPIKDGLKRFLRTIKGHHIIRLELLDIGLSKTTFTLLGEMVFLKELTIANCGLIPTTYVQKLLPGRSYNGPLSKLTIVQSELGYGEDGIDVRFIQKKGFRTVQTPAIPISHLRWFQLSEEKEDYLDSEIHYA